MPASSRSQLTRPCDSRTPAGSRLQMIATRVKAGRAETRPDGSHPHSCARPLTSFRTFQRCLFLPVGWPRSKIGFARAAAPTGAWPTRTPAPARANSGDPAPRNGMSLPQLDRKRGENGLVSCIPRLRLLLGTPAWGLTSPGAGMARSGSSGRLRADVRAHFAASRDSRRGGSAGCGGLPAALPGSADVSGLDRWPPR
jgi:hypothetical protein